MYVVVAMTAVSGFATVAMSRALPAIISGAALPDLDAVPPSAMHIGAALYHQFILRDRLLARMGLGRQRGM